MDECGVDKVALMGVICDPIPKTPEFQLKLLRFLLTNRSFRFIAKILTTNFTPEGDIKIPTGFFRLYPDPKNEPVFQAVTGKPNRFLG
jgi:hypothetical protein